MRLVSKFMACAVALALVACGPTAPQPQGGEGAETGAFSTDALKAKLGEKLGEALGGEAAARAAFDQLIGAAGLEAKWTEIEAGIRAGEQKWLALVPALEGKLSGAMAEGLDKALSNALATNAAGVLALVSSSRTVESLCAPRPSPAGGTATAAASAQAAPAQSGPEQAADWKARAVAAVTAVADPALAEAKAACLAQLQK